jgi:hypothetical protein
MIAQAISNRASWAILEPMGAILREILPQDSPNIWKHFFELQILSTPHPPKAPHRKLNSKIELSASHCEYSFI